MSNRLTDLEAIVLGVVRRLEPCTTYQVHQVFLKSPSLFFSGSAGAIYPVVKRMRTRGLLSATAGKTGKRRHTFLSLTLAGRTDFEHWMHDFELAADAGFDPVRARMSLWTSDPADASVREFLNRLLQSLNDRLEVVRNRSSSDDPPGIQLDLARELEICTLMAKVELIGRWLARSK